MSLDESVAVAQRERSAAGVLTGGSGGANGDENENGHHPIQSQCRATFFVRAHSWWDRRKLRGQRRRLFRAREYNLLNWPDTGERGWRALLGWAGGIGVTLAFALFIFSYFVPGPGTPGFDAVDGNSYLVSGKNIAHYGHFGLHPDNDLAYLGPMWFRTDDGWYYPKYPPGLPLLNAAAICIGGSDTAAYYVQPVCSILAVLGMFILGRALAGSFLGMMAAILLGSNPTFLHQSVVPLSHAPAVAFAIWGMLLLFAWMRGGRWWLGVIGGFLIGYVTLIRYSEGVLGLCVGVAALGTIRWSRWRSYLLCILPLLAWALPVLLLAWFNYKATGKLTSYDATNESHAFSVEHFQRKWEYSVQQLCEYGVFLVFGIGVLGSLLVTARSWRIGLMLICWFWPVALVCNAYYWGIGAEGLTYLRLFLTAVPALILGAMWLAGAGVREALRASRQSRARAVHPLLRFAATVLVCTLAGATLTTLYFIFFNPGIVVQQADTLLHLNLPRPTIAQILHNNVLSLKWGAIGGAIAGALMGFPRGRPALGCGAFVTAVALLGFYTETPELVRLNALNANSYYLARMLAIGTDGRSHHTAARPDPIYFIEGNRMFDPLLLQMQFEGDGTWYSTDAFTKHGDIGGGMLGDRGQLQQADVPGADVNRATLVPPQRMRYMMNLFAQMSPEQMKQLGHQVISDALGNEVPIFVWAPPHMADEFRKRLQQEGFDCVLLMKFREPLDGPLNNGVEPPDWSRFNPGTAMDSRRHWLLPDLHSLGVPQRTYEILQVIRGPATRPK